MRIDVDNIDGLALQKKRSAMSDLGAKSQSHRSALLRGAMGDSSTVFVSWRGSKPVAL